MPKLYRKSNGSSYTKKLIHGQIVTQQIKSEGVDWLSASGFKPNDEIGDEYWELQSNGWLYTKGEVEGGGEIDLSEDPGNDPESLLGSYHANIGEPHRAGHSNVTTASSQMVVYAPRFLYDPYHSVYYTQLTIANTDPGFVSLRVLIKNRGAVELLRMGVNIGDELSEHGLNMLLARRWVYCNP